MPPVTTNVGRRRLTIAMLVLSVVLLAFRLYRLANQGPGDNSAEILSSVGICAGLTCSNLASLLGERHSGQRLFSMLGVVLLLGSVLLMLFGRQL
jgi:hypothetical protein